MVDKEQGKWMRFIANGYSQALAWPAHWCWQVEQHGSTDTHDNYTQNVLHAHVHTSIHLYRVTVT